VKHIKAKILKEPLVILPLKQYENLMGYLEDLEDRLAILERSKEPTISQEEVERNFSKKFGRK
jgi:hypothetical protein